MTTDLEQRLREALHGDAQRARLANPDRPADPAAQPLMADSPRTGRLARRHVAAAAAIVLVIVAGVAVIQNRESEPSVSTDSGLARVFADLSVGDAEVFTDIAPGSTVNLPSAPISRRESPAIVWSGREVIVWGGIGAGGATLADGAALDLSTGTWRVIAPAPIEDRALAAVAWTGAEMVVFGGLRRTGAVVDGTYAQTPLTDGAAYNPTTDTWRLLPEVPIDGDASSGLWTGDDFIVIGGANRDQMASYDPAKDEWRRLADPPEGFDNEDVVWTGEAILTTVTAVVDSATNEPTRIAVVRYDPRNDRWQPVQDLASAVSLMPVTDADGVARAVLALPGEARAPIVVLDPSGSTLGTLPGLPADPAKFGDRYLRPTIGGVWAGHEALIWIRSADPSLSGATEVWALNPATGAWRLLNPDDWSPSIFSLAQLATDAGVFIGWGGIDADAPFPGGLAYRPPTPAGA